MEEQTPREKQKDMLSKVLNEREKRIISLRYGFATGDALTLEQVGEIMGVTRERIRQIESKALKKLRGHPRLQYLKDYLHTSDMD